MNSTTNKSWSILISENLPHLAFRLNRTGTGDQKELMGAKVQSSVHVFHLWVELLFVLSDVADYALIGKSKGSVFARLSWSKTILENLLNYF